MCSYWAVMELLSVKSQSVMECNKDKGPRTP